MKRKIFSLTIALAIVFSTTIISSAAENAEVADSVAVQHEVKTIEKEVKQANGDSVFTAKEEKIILQKHSTEALAAYKNKVLNEAVKEVNEAQPALNANEKYKRESFTLDNGEVVVVEMLDLAEDEKLNLDERKAINGGAVQTMSASGAAGLKATDHKIVRGSYFKKNGKRYFTAKYTVGYLRGSISLTVENHYSIGSYGLKERYGNRTVNHTGLYNGFEVNDDDIKITDYSAQKPGQDINIVGWVKFSLSGPASSGQKTMELDTRVKLVSQMKAGAKVTEHFYVRKNFF